VFLTLKIIKSTLEFIRLEGEVENKSFIKTLIQRLEGKTIKLSGFPDTLKVKAGEAKISFPLMFELISLRSLTFPSCKGPASECLHNVSRQILRRLSVTPVYPSHSGMTGIHISEMPKI
jgi:hypothetical protein